MSIVVSAETKARISTSAARMPLPSVTDPNIGKVAIPKAGVYQGIRGILYPRREAVLYDILDDKSTIGELMASNKPYLVLFFFDNGELFCGIAAKPSELDVVGGYTPLIDGSGTYAYPYPCGSVTLGVGAATMDIGKKYYYDLDTGVEGLVTVDYRFGAIDPNSYILIQQLDGTILMRIDQTARSGSKSFYYLSNMGTMVTATRHVSASLTNTDVSFKLKCPVYVAPGTVNNPFPCGDGWKGFNDLSETMSNGQDTTTYYFMGNQAGKFTFMYDTSEYIRYTITYSDGTPIHSMSRLTTDNPGQVELEFDPTVSTKIRVQTVTSYMNNYAWKYMITCSYADDSTGIDPVPPPAPGDTDPDDTPVIIGTGTIADPLVGDSGITGRDSADTYHNLGTESGTFQIDYSFDGAIEQAVIIVRYVKNGRDADVISGYTYLSNSGTITGVYDPELGELVKVSISYSTANGQPIPWEYSLDFTSDVVPADGSEIHPYPCGTTITQHTGGYDKGRVMYFDLGSTGGEFQVAWEYNEHVTEMGYLSVTPIKHNGTQGRTLRAEFDLHGAGVWSLPYDPTLYKMIRVHATATEHHYADFVYTVGCVE